LKQVIEVWAFVLALFTIVFLVSSKASTSVQQVPSSFSLAFAAGAIEGEFVVVVAIILFLAYFVRHYEGGNFRTAISSLGLNLHGVRRSLLWAMVFVAMLAPAVLLWEVVIAGLFGNSFATAQTLASGIPQWYAGLLMIPVFLNAIMEESIGRGYMLDRLMPSHPAGMLASLPAVLGVSVLGTLYHIPTYVMGYQFSPVSLLFNFGVVFLSFTFVGLAYVRSRVRNISGPILVHFLLDAVPYLMLL
jgi:membrane protease YdiL (CAAX protease family)